MLRLDHIKSYYLYTANVLQQFQKIWKKNITLRISPNIIFRNRFRSSYFSYGNALYSLCPDIDEKQLTKITNFIHGELKRITFSCPQPSAVTLRICLKFPASKPDCRNFNTLKNSSHFVMLYRDLETNPVAVMYEKSNYFQVLLNSLSSGDKTMIQRHFDEISQFFTRQTPDEFNSFMYSFMTLFLSFFSQLPRNCQIRYVRSPKHRKSFFQPPHFRKKD